MSNHLIAEKSPYLQQHAHNPVDWYPWSEEAFDKARREDKPIFLSVGYSTCHWCHVMERESFESGEIARILNRSFVPIKVDREERPDVDRIYMTYVQATTGSGGWPMSVFLTPELKPFFGEPIFLPTIAMGGPGSPPFWNASRRPGRTSTTALCSPAAKWSRNLRNTPARLTRTAPRSIKQFSMRRFSTSAAPSTQPMAASAMRQSFLVRWR